MTDIKKNIDTVFGNKLRIRVCGVCLKGDSILMIKHRGIGEGGFLWAPPGGGVEYGVSVKGSLIREFKEETGLSIKVNHLIRINEHLKSPLHAIELFFHVEIMGGKLKTGYDPELDSEQQIIEEVRFMNLQELNSINRAYKHSFFTNTISSFEEITKTIKKSEFFSSP